MSVSLELKEQRLEQVKEYFKYWVVNKVDNDYSSNKYFMSFYKDTKLASQRGEDVMWSLCLRFIDKLKHSPYIEYNSVLWNMTWRVSMSINKFVLSSAGYKSIKENNKYIKSITSVYNDSSKEIDVKKDSFFISVANAYDFQKSNRIDKNKLSVIRARNSDSNIKSIKNKGKEEIFLNPIFAKAFESIRNEYSYKWLKEPKTLRSLYDSLYKNSFLKCDFKEFKMLFQNQNTKQITWYGKKNTLLHFIVGLKKYEYISDSSFLKKIENVFVLKERKNGKVKKIEINTEDYNFSSDYQSNQLSDTKNINIVIEKLLQKYLE